MSRSHVRNNSLKIIDYSNNLLSVLPGLSIFFRINSIFVAAVLNFTLIFLYFYRFLSTFNHHHLIVSQLGCVDYFFVLHDSALCWHTFSLALTESNAQVPPTEFLKTRLKCNGAAL